MPTIPTLTTERLRLRACRATDLAPYAAMWQQPDFYRYLTGQPSPEEDCWQRMLRFNGAWDMLGYGYWAVEEQASGDFVGAVGFADWCRDMTPSLRGYPEMGWVLAPHTHGRGYATEATQMALAWADAHLPERRTVCIISPDNAPSLQLAAKLGYQQLTTGLYKGQATEVLERIR